MRKQKLIKQRARSTKKVAPGVVTMVNKVGGFAPERLRTILNYDQQFLLPAATLIAPWGLEILKLTAPNNLTTIATTIPGYSALLADYRKYRMYHVSLKFTVVNRDPAVAIEIFAWHVNFLPSASTDPTRFLSLCGKRHRKLLAPGAGINVGAVSLATDVAAFGGSEATRVEDSYVGNTDGTADPTDNVYVIYGYRTLGALAVTVSPAATISVNLTGEYFELQSPAN